MHAHFDNLETAPSIKWPNATLAPVSAVSAATASTPYWGPAPVVQRCWLHCVNCFVAIPTQRSFICKLIHSLLAFGGPRHCRGHRDVPVGNTGALCVLFCYHLYISLAMFASFHFEQLTTCRHDKRGKRSKQIKAALHKAGSPQFPRRSGCVRVDSIDPGTRLG